MGGFGFPAKASLDDGNLPHRRLAGIHRGGGKSAKLLAIKFLVLGRYEKVPLLI